MSRPTSGNRPDESAEQTSSGKSLFEKAYGSIQLQPKSQVLPRHLCLPCGFWCVLVCIPIPHLGCPKPQAYPLAPAPAPKRQAGSVGPVAPLREQTAMQTEAMMIGMGAFHKDLSLHRRDAGGLVLTRGDQHIGPLGHVYNWQGQRARAV